MITLSKERRQLVLTTALALSAFAGNSILCRLALADPLVDAASFSALRLGSGALCLTALASIGRERVSPKPTPVGAFCLAAYALPFSYAYVELDAGTGALILFGAVQLSMLISAVVAGERFPPARWLGLLVACLGLVYLVLPGVSAPSLRGSILMTIAGVAWGVYSLRGRSATAPLVSNARNFVWATPLALLVCVGQADKLHASTRGVGLALASGVVASGLGYALWYAALPKLSRTQASVLQLSVPVLAAGYGGLFMAETFTTRLLLAMLAILGGVGLTLLRDSKPAPTATNQQKAQAPKG